MTPPRTLEPDVLLGRAPLPLELPETFLAGAKLMVTGSAGSVGVELAHMAHEAGASVLEADTALVGATQADDVMDPSWLRRCHQESPDAIIHLAAHKRADLGEEDPYGVAELNVTGTRKALAAARELGVPLVVASTCKAADPCTAYGASKLIAERIAVNDYSLGAAVRLVNVLGSSGSVAALWEQLPPEAPLPVALDCQRYFIAAYEAAALLLWALTEHGVYGPDPFMLRRVKMSDMAQRLHPGRVLQPILPRRGDRKTERLIGDNEKRLALKDRCRGVVRIIESWEAV